jgi:formyl-CoA transferase
VDEIISEWTRKHDKYEAMRVIGAAVPAGAVRDTLELLNDPNFEERAIIQKIQHPAHGAFKMAGWPVRFNGHPPAVKPAPLLGEHSGEALKDWLGMTDQQVAALRDDKII